MTFFCSSYSLMSSPAPSSPFLPLTSISISSYSQNPRPLFLLSMFLFCTHSNFASFHRLFILLVLHIYVLACSLFFTPSTDLFFHIVFFFLLLSMFLFRTQSLSSPPSTGFFFCSSSCSSSSFMSSPVLPSPNPPPSRWQDGRMAGWRGGLAGCLLAGGAARVLAGCFVCRVSKQDILLPC